MYQMASIKEIQYLCTDSNRYTQICNNNFSKHTTAIEIIKPIIVQDFNIAKNLDFHQSKLELIRDIYIDWNYSNGGTFMVYKVGDFVLPQEGHFVLKTMYKSSTIYKFLNFSFDGAILTIKNVKSLAGEN
jgi:hypothetical protein